MKHNTRQKIKHSALFGSDIRKLRRSQDITVQRVVDMLDISEKTYRRFEQGAHDMRLSQILLLCDLLGFELVIDTKQ